MSCLITVQYISANDLLLGIERGRGLLEKVEKKVRKKKLKLRVELGYHHHISLEYIRIGRRVTD